MIRKVFVAELRRQDPRSVKDPVCLLTVGIDLVIQKDQIRLPRNHFIHEAHIDSVSALKNLRRPLLLTPDPRTDLVQMQNVPF